MKAIRFFSRFTLICNICFVLFALLNYSESTGSTAAGVVERIPVIKEIIILLGFPAIVINLLMCIAYVVVFAMGKRRIIPRNLAIINVAFLVIQTGYFFLF